MSFSEYNQLELKSFKPNLKFKLGELVIFKKDQKKRPFVITDFLVHNWRTHKEDYLAKRISPQGKIIIESFKENELLKIEQNELT